MDPDTKPIWLTTAFTGERLWRYFFTSIGKPLVFIVLLSSLTGVCSSRRGGSDDEDEDDNEENWYQLWYFWLILSLFLAGVLLLVFMYCKQQAKQARLEGMGRFRAQMVLPPAYDEPVQPPPPYSVAAAASSTDCVQPTHLRHLYQQNQLSYLPYNASILSSSTTRAESVPPPYSPPPYSAHEDPRDDDLRTSPAEDATTLHSGSSTSGPRSGCSAATSMLRRTPNSYSSRTSGAQRSTLERMQATGYHARIHNRNSNYNPVPTVNNQSSCVNDSQVYSISQSQLSINLRRSDAVTNHQPYDVCRNEIVTTNDVSRSRGSCNETNYTGLSSSSRQPSHNSGLCVANLSHMYQNERLNHGASVSRDSSRLVTPLSYNLSDSGTVSANSRRLYERNAPSSGKIYHKPSTSVPLNMSITSIGSSNNSASVGSASGSNIPSRPLSRQINNLHHTRLS